MLAFLVNGIAIIIAAILGVIFKKYIKKEICDSILKAVGVTVLLFGIAGVLRYMLVIEVVDGVYTIRTTNELVLIITLALGTFLGEIIKIDENLTKFGNYIEKKLNKSSFSEGFVSATLVFCVGAMAVVGSVADVLGDPSIIYLKAIIDAVTALVLASTLGFGVIFSGVSVILYQGLITLIVAIFGAIFTTNLVEAFSMVGYAMVGAIGLNFLLKDRIKVANMLPSLILVILYYVVFK